ncbi:hypothetical protein H6P81_006787 [Aristolochia fimbriata]|uniref:Thioesterase domain-containing protein n=1 Tax=Aristolochia fimbriata TaxID=158543 RepID=A0AAV7EYM9_ARIFI|nr:hypothetical protein H6P81_006787 [Aristolochia fimbriata]
MEEMGREAMEKAKLFLACGEEEAGVVSELAALPRRRQFPSLFEGLFLRGMKIDRMEPGLVVYSFKVPPRLTDSNGTLSPGAIADLLDVAGGSATLSYGLPVQVTVNLAIQYLSSAKIDEELEMTARFLKNVGIHSYTSIHLRSKTTGELVACCQQLCSLKPRSKI